MANGTGAPASTNAHRLLTLGVVVAVILGATGAYSTLVPRTTSAPAGQTVWHNQTIENNRTVYVNTTTNATSPHWDNTTVFVNTTTYDNGTTYENSTVYVNTTVVESVPVVNVTAVDVDFASPSLGTNYSVPVPANYSLPVGAVTWVQFTLNETTCGGGYRVAVNVPWVLLSHSDGSTPQTITVDAVLGVPYWPGTYAIVLTVSS